MSDCYHQNGGASDSKQTNCLESCDQVSISGAKNVVKKTHNFLHGLRSRLSKGRNRDFRTRSPGADSQSTDYAADLSGSEASSNNPSRTQSPKHRSELSQDTSYTRAEDNDVIDSQSLIHFKSSQLLTATVDLLQPADEVRRKREAILREHSFFHLRIHLKRGQNLVAMDKNGTSDPYVKFKMGGRLLYKSRTLHKDLNPLWDENFTIPIEDPFQLIQIKVYDYDWGLQDDFMGSAYLDITTLNLSRPQEIVLNLTDPTRPGRDLGEIILTCTLWPKTQEDKEQYLMQYPKICDANRRLKSQIWSSVVTITLVEAKDIFVSTETNGEILSMEPYVKFRLGNEKYRSKASWRVRWLEQFDLHLFDDQEQLLELSMWAKTKLPGGSKGRELFIGKTVINLAIMERECTHGQWFNLEDISALDGVKSGEMYHSYLESSSPVVNYGKIFLLLTISGTTASETISDLTVWKEDPREYETMRNRYSWKQSLQNLRDVGHLTVKVFGASGLAAADLGGKSDPFCVLELINARLQTQTEYKTLSPNWQKIFTFNVKDITSVLEITVYDEDKNNKVEFLGKVAIPLLRIKNGERKWYALKDKKLRARAKGLAPQILLEMTVAWCSIRAALRALTPKEEKLIKSDVKFKRQIFVRNVLRLKKIIMYFLELGRIVQSCFEWESRTRSFLGLLLWLIICHWFHVCFIPLAGILLFARNWLRRWLLTPAEISSFFQGSPNPNIPLPSDDDDVLTEEDDEDDKDKEEKKTLKERLQAIQEVTQTVQNSIGYLASLGERVKNTFNFSVPPLSWLAVFLMSLATIVLYLVPVRILLMLWGINKFFRRILRPHVVPNNEVLDLLSRVPDDEDLISYRDLKLTQTSDVDRKRESRKKHKIF